MNLPNISGNLLEKLKSKTGAFFVRLSTGRRIEILKDRFHFTDFSGLFPKAKM